LLTPRAARRFRRALTAASLLVAATSVAACKPSSMVVQNWSGGPSEVVLWAGAKPVSVACGAGFSVDLSGAPDLPWTATASRPGSRVPFARHTIEQFDPGGDLVIYGDGMALRTPTQLGGAAPLPCS
jgi:hypothetical protein